MNVYHLGFLQVRYRSPLEQGITKKDIKYPRRLITNKPNRRTNLALHPGDPRPQLTRLKIGKDEICDSEAGWGWPELRTEEHFHRLLISLGYAARRMPRLKNMKFEVESQDKFTIYLSNKSRQDYLGMGMLLAPISAR